MNLKDKAVVIDNKTYRYSKIVMLATNESSTICGNTILEFRGNEPQIDSLQNQHLYFLSTDKICEGDWFYNTFNGIIGKSQLRKWGKDDVSFKIIASTDPSLNLPKPSDSFLQVYIDAYNKGEKIEECLVEYNFIHIHKNLHIDNLVPTSEEICYNTPLNTNLFWFDGKTYNKCIVTDRHLNGNGGIKLLKFNKNHILKGNRGIGLRHLYSFSPKITKGEITIRKIKDSWNREEVVEAIINCCVSCDSEGGLRWDEVKDWISKNL